MMSAYLILQFIVLICNYHFILCKSRSDHHTTKDYRVRHRAKRVSDHFSGVLQLFLPGWGEPQSTTDKPWLKTTTGRGKNHDWQLTSDKPWLPLQRDKGMALDKPHLRNQLKHRRGIWFLHILFKLFLKTVAMVGKSYGGCWMQMYYRNKN